MFSLRLISRFDVINYSIIYEMTYAYSSRFRIPSERRGLEPEAGFAVVQSSRPREQKTQSVSQFRQVRYTLYVPRIYVPTSNLSYGFIIIIIIMLLKRFVNILYFAFAVPWTRLQKNTHKKINKTKSLGNYFPEVEIRRPNCCNNVRFKTNYV